MTLSELGLIVVIGSFLILMLVMLVVRTYFDWRLQYRHRDVYRTFRTPVPWWRTWASMNAQMGDLIRFGTWWRDKGWRDLDDPRLTRAAELLERLRPLAIAAMTIAFVYGFIFWVTRVR